MKRIYLLLIIIAISINSLAQSEIQTILNQQKDSIGKKGIVALVQYGNKIETAEIGLKDLINPINKTDLFCIGSATKMFTATAILKLVEENKLSLNDTIGQFYSLAPLDSIDKTISIKSLLNHSSGIHDYIDNAKLLNISLRNPYGDYSTQTLLKRANKMDFTKGTKTVYCNSNFLILKLILEETLDRQYEEIINELIISPLNLSNTLTSYSSKTPNLTVPEFKGQSLMSVPKCGINKATVGVGNFVSNVFDMNKFIRKLLFDKEIINDNTIKSMTDFSNDTKNVYGLGLEQHFVDDIQIVGHSGRTLSYSTFIYANPKKKLSVVVMCNSYDGMIAYNLYKEIFRKYNDKSD